MAHYFHHFLKNLSPWYDLSDQQCTFGTALATKSLKEPALFSAIIALSALHIHNTAAPTARGAADFYHGCCVPMVARLRAELGSSVTGTCLATICLLRSYEVLEGKCVNVDYTAIVSDLQ